MFDKGLSGGEKKKQPWLVAPAGFSGINTSAVTSFKLPTWLSLNVELEAMCTASSRELVWAGSDNCDPDIHSVLNSDLWVAHPGVEFSARRNVMFMMSQGQERTVGQAWSSAPTFFPYVKKQNKTFCECRWRNWHIYYIIGDNENEYVLEGQFGSTYQHLKCTHPLILQFHFKDFIL